MIIVSDINTASIQQKLEAYAKSPAGKKAIRDVIHDIIIGSKQSIDGGIVTLQGMDDLAFEFKSMINDEAAIVSLPDSVFSDLDSLWYQDPHEREDGKYEVVFTFDGDVSRPSLMSIFGKRNEPKTVGRTGDGIENIVYLFETGYPVSSEGTPRHVYGTWDGHEDLGVIRSRNVMAGLHFIQSAVDKFNAKYSKNGATAILKIPDYSK